MKTLIHTIQNFPLNQASQKWMAEIQYAIRAQELAEGPFEYHFEWTDVLMLGAAAFPLLSLAFTGCTDLHLTYVHPWFMQAVH